jgi:hypothetical protein
MTKLWEIVKDMKQIDEFRQTNHMVNAGRRRRVGQVRAFGTSDGAVRGWDSRGRAKGKNFEPSSSVVPGNSKRMCDDCGNHRATGKLGGRYLCNDCQKNAAERKNPDPTETEATFKVASEWNTNR